MFNAVLPTIVESMLTTNSTITITTATVLITILLMDCTYAVIAVSKGFTNKASTTSYYFQQLSTAN
jgi:hypothetical protein